MNDGLSGLNPKEAAGSKRRRKAVEYERPDFEEYCPRCQKHGRFSVPFRRKMQGDVVTTTVFCSCSWGEYYRERAENATRRKLQNINNLPDELFPHSLKRGEDINLWLIHNEHRLRRATGKGYYDFIEEKWIEPQQEEQEDDSDLPF